jgi:hypothetical protein
MVVLSLGHVLQLHWNQVLSVTSPNSPAAGSYYYYPVYTSSASGCTLATTTAEQTAVAVATAPTWGTITAPTANICQGGSVTFSAAVITAMVALSRGHVPLLHFGSGTTVDLTEFSCSEAATITILLIFISERLYIGYDHISADRSDRRTDRRHTDDYYC